MIGTLEAVNHWEDYGGGPDARWVCKKTEEHCHRCGARLVEHIETGMFRSRRTGGPTYVRYHSCPTWFTGWRTSKWARWWAAPGDGHESHDADLPLSSRGYL